jgi:hypothetical protein
MSLPFHGKLAMLCDTATGGRKASENKGSRKMDTAGARHGGVRDHL